MVRRQLDVAGVLGENTIKELSVAEEARIYGRIARKPLPDQAKTPPAAATCIKAMVPETAVRCRVRVELQLLS